MNAYCLTNPVSGRARALRARTVSNALLSAVLWFAWMAPGAVLAADDWPRELRSDGSTILVYQPQFDSLEGVEAKARIAVAIRRDGAAEPEFGALWVNTTLATDRDADLARVAKLDIERTRFPDATEAEVAELTRLIERAMPTWDFEFSLEELKAGLEAEGGAADPGFRNDPPRIVYRDRPAILVALDGQPQLRPIENSRYQRVANTPFPIALDPSTGDYWLYGSEIWFTTRDLLRGRWEARNAAPAGIASLFSSDDGSALADAAGGAPPEKLASAEIIVATEPTELISTDGTPQYQALVGDELLYVTNTDSDLFIEVPTRDYYVVLSGRWYRARSLEGPWTFVEPSAVPQAFADVPRMSGKARVLAHVPGTEEAKDAVMDAMIPQTTAVRRGPAELSITYDGVPLFEQIPGTDLMYARNTPAQVLKYRNHYYAVDQGVWYESDSAHGPWRVAESRPETVEDIPASSPAYNVKYVYIYDHTPEVVYVGYLPGYTWAFPYAGTLVYGTGYYYRPWIGAFHYYPRPSTWGFHTHYDPWYGWGYGGSWIAGWSSFSFAWGSGWGSWRHGYGPGYRDGYWHGYNRGFWAGQHTGGWFGPGGYRPPHRWGERRGIQPIPDRTVRTDQPSRDLGIPRDRRAGDRNIRSRDPRRLVAPESDRRLVAPARGLRRDPGPAARNNLYRIPGNVPTAPTERRARPDRDPRFAGTPRGAPRDSRSGKEIGTRNDVVRSGRETAPANDRRINVPRSEDSRNNDSRNNNPRNNDPRSADRPRNDVYVDREGVPHRLTRDGWQARENRQWRAAPEVGRDADRGSRRQAPAIRSGTWSGTPSPERQARSQPSPRSQIAPRVTATPRIELAPRAEAPRVQPSPRFDSRTMPAPRAQPPRAPVPRTPMPRTEAPRAQAPRMERAPRPRTEAPRRSVEPRGVPRGGASLPSSQASRERSGEMRRSAPAARPQRGDRR